MFCAECGTELNDDALFCRKCGARVEETADDTTQLEDATLLVPGMAAVPYQAAPRYEGSLFQQEAPAAQTWQMPSQQIPSQLSQPMQGDPFNTSPSQAVIVPTPKRNKTPLIAGAIAAVAVIAVIGILAVGGKLPFLAKSAKGLPVSYATIIAPVDSNGAQLGAYEARLLDANDRVIAQATVGSGGFTMQDFGRDDLADGIYKIMFIPIVFPDEGQPAESSGGQTAPDNASQGNEPSAQSPYPELTIEYKRENPAAPATMQPQMSDNGAEWALPSEQAGASSEAASAASASASADAAKPTAQQTMYKLYYDKVREYEGIYGTAEIRDINSNVSVLGGLGLAVLIDFDGDGMEELLVAYCKDDGNIPQDRIVFEVWAYGDNAIRQVHKQRILNHGQNDCLVVRWYSNPDGTAYLTGGDNVSFTWEVLAFDGGDRFDSILKVERDGGSGPSYRKINGETVSEERWKQAQNEILGASTPTTYFFGAAWQNLEKFDGICLTANETMQLTRDTIQHLQDGMAKDDKASSSAAAASSSAGSASAAAAQAALQQEAFGSFPHSFTFSSGAGGWSSGITIQPDGTFSGGWHDSNMGESGNGYKATVYESEFHGKFTVTKKVSDTEYLMTLDYLVMDSDDSEWIEDQVRHVSTGDSAYGLGDPTDSPRGGWHFYLAGQPTAGLDKEFLGWVFMTKESQLTKPCLYDDVDKNGWSG